MIEFLEGKLPPQPHTPSQISA